jgi:hypothetical protein
MNTSPFSVTESNLPTQTRHCNSHNMYILEMNRTVHTVQYIYVSATYFVPSGICVTFLCSMGLKSVSIDFSYRQKDVDNYLIKSKVGT